MKWTKTPPSWFKIADYVATPKLDFVGWTRMLWIRRYYQEALPSSIKLGRHFKCSFDQKGYWDAYFCDSRLANAQEPLNSTFPSGRGPTRSIPLDDITDETRHNPEVAGRMMALDIVNFGLRILTVDLGAADPVLIKAYRSWLANCRKQRPSPVKRRGPRSMNKVVSQDRLDSWSDHQVLAVLDLDFFALLFASGRLTHEALCDLLTEKPVGPKDWGKMARKRAREALDAVDSLLSQVQGGAK
jgi:hypothetical protein